MTPEFIRIDQVMRLHRAVGENIKIFHFDTENRLPSKEGKFDWSLGAAKAACRHDPRQIVPGLLPRLLLAFLKN